MYELINKFGEQLNDAITIAINHQFKEHKVAIRNIVFTGMGGSGIGARIVAQWVEKEIQLPISFIQHYEIPAFINSETLVIAASYSGNTEETIESVKKCLNNGAKVVGVCSGGELHEICLQYQLDCILIPKGFPPRAALAYSLAQHLIILSRFNLIRLDSIEQFKNSITFLADHTEEIKLKAKEVVSVINKTQLVIYAESPYESIAIRAKQQFNENSKYLCRYHVIPEMNHNELLGWGSGDDNHSAVFLYNSDMNPNNLKRFELTQKIVENQTKKVIALHSRGRNRVEESLYFIHLLDWASYYLGKERGVDVMEIEKIDFLKSELAKMK